MMYRRLISASISSHSQLFHTRFSRIYAQVVVADFKGQNWRCYKSNLFHSSSRKSSSSPSVFVSKHYTISNPHEICEFLSRKGMQYKDTGLNYSVKKCPFCHPIKNMTSNMHKLHIEKQSGVYFCHRCGAKGSWLQFKQRVGGSEGQVHVTSMNEVNSSKSTMGHSSPDSHHHHHHHRFIRPLDSSKAIGLQQRLYRIEEEVKGRKEDELKEEEREIYKLWKYLTETRGLKRSTLERYGIGCVYQDFREDFQPSSSSSSSSAYESGWTPYLCISFPWMGRRSDIEAMGLSMFDSEQIEDKELTEEEVESKTKKLDENFHVIRLKIRAAKDKSKQRLIPTGGSWGLFGWQTIPNSATSVVLTEGEFDAMAVYQSTKAPSLSLPNGCRSLPPSLLPLLESFSEIFLWLDNDVHGQENVMKFAEKLGIHRIRLVQPQWKHASKEEQEERKEKRYHLKLPKDANEAMLRGWKIKEMLEDASPIPHEQITTFEELKLEVWREIANPLAAAGLSFGPYHQQLTHLLKGHRLGELTVFTGPTGAGKTTFLSQLSMDLCQKGRRTLWGSFELPNRRLIKKMLRQMAHTPLEQMREERLEELGEEFSHLPMYFMRFVGSTEVDQVLDAMDYAVYAYDVSHIILDNIQFMMSGQGRGYDKFEKQDNAIEQFRRFATRHNVHITMVIHPRKEQEATELNLSSIFGTAKATQEADNVLILQRLKEGMVQVDLRKNRFDGTLGSIPLKFDRSSERLMETTKGHQATSSPVLESLTPEEADTLLFLKQQDIVSDDKMPFKSMETNVPENEFEILKEKIESHSVSSPNVSNTSKILVSNEPFSKFTRIIHK